jgi:hypothetical protein
MIGSLMYVMTTTQPDITYPIGVLTRYNHDPSNEHMVALQGMFWNLNGTKDWRLGVNGALGGALQGALGGALGVALGGVLAESTLGGEAECSLRCCVDSDYARCPHDYKSTNGPVITCGGPVDWRSREQMSTAQSTTDAEYYAFGVGCM